MDRDILHIYIPAFPIALARIGDPSLRGRPVVVASAHSERAPVEHLSEEARSEGLFEGMPLFKAKRLCPSISILPPDPRRVSGGHRSLTTLTHEYSPVWEPSAAGRIYLDLTGSTRLFGPGRDAALRLERDLSRRLGLTGCVGVAGSTSIGAHCAIGGGAGILGHLSIADGTTITATSLVTKSIKSPGVYSSGTPLEPSERWQRNFARFKQLDDMARRLKALEKELAQLKNHNQG